MAYSKTTWANGDVITAAKLNNMENGIAGAASVLALTMDGDTFAFDKTWQEIHDAIAAGIPVVASFEVEGDTYTVVAVQTLITNGQYKVSLGAQLEANADSASGYPALSGES